MRLRTATRWTVRLAVAAAFLSMTSAGDYPAWALVAGLLVIAGSAALPGEPPAALAVTLLVITGVSMVGLLASTITGALDPVLSASLVAAVVCFNRLLSRRRAADDGMIYLTSLLMVAAGAALSGEVAFGICFALFGVAATVGMTLSHLERTADDGAAPESDRQSLISRRLLITLAALSALSLTGATAFFVLFPRFNARWWSRKSGVGANPVVGFSESVQLGNYGVGRSDPRPALHVVLDRDPGVDRLDLLWRGRTLDIFDGTTWRVGPQSLLPHPARVTSGDPTDFHARVEVLPTVGSRVIFSVGLPQRVHTTALDNPAESAVFHHVEWNAQGDAFEVPTPQGYYAYEVWSRLPKHTPGATAASNREIPEAVRTLDLQLPEKLDPRIPALARSWAAGRSQPADIARAIEMHLQDEFGYTVRQPGHVDDQIANFLFVRKEGHCEYFSTAMVLLLRSLGIPAREVTGFTGGVRAPGADYFVIRAGDAHSWVEAYLPGMGFIPFDPSPLTFRDQGPGGLLALASVLFDELASRWRVAVMEYDLRTQFQLLASVGRALSDATARLRRPEPGHVRPGWLGWALGGGLIVMLALLWVARRHRSDPARQQQEVSRLYLTAVRTLEKRGHARAPGETPLEFAKRLSALGIRQAAELQRITALYNACRFGDVEFSLEQRAQLRASLSHL